MINRFHNFITAAAGQTCLSWSPAATSCLASKQAGYQDYLSPPIAFSPLSRELPHEK